MIAYRPIINSCKYLFYLFFCKNIWNKVFIFTIVLSSVVSLLTILPMHFYDLTEDKHRKIIEELQRRQRVKHGEEVEPDPEHPRDDAPLAAQEVPV